jgi:hypothetical protein
MDVYCNNCGASDWDKLFDIGYPEKRRDRDQTVKTVYRCEECGSEGRHFDRQSTGTEQLTGAMR